MLSVVREASGPTVLALLFMLSPGNGTAQTWLPSSAAGGPTPRTGQAAVMDPNTQRMIVVGGYASPNGQPSNAADVNDAWLLQLGTNEWVQLPSLPAAARDSHAPIYDPSTTNLTIFGGKNVGGMCFNDTWVLNGTSNAWTQVAGSGPASRGGASAVYDPVSNEMIIFGGRCNSTGYSDVWVLSHANGVNGTPVWTQLSPYGALPSPRSGQTAVYDPKLDRMTVFGGSSNGTLLNDAWVLYNANRMGTQRIRARIHFRRFSSNGDCRAMCRFRATTMATAGRTSPFSGPRPAPGLC